MPSTIPYDPSLVLGQIVEPRKLHALRKVAEAIKPVDEAEAALNELLLTKMSLETTLTEVQSLGVGVNDKLNAKIHQLDESIDKALENLVNEKIKAYVPTDGGIGTVKAAEMTVSALGGQSEVASPVDYIRSQIKMLPLSSNSIHFDSQYFSLDTNGQGSKTQISQIRSFVAASAKYLGNEASAKLSSAAQAQVSRQHQDKKLLGTLVITATATHENARMLEPLIYRPDDARKVYNHFCRVGDHVDEKNLLPDSQIKMQDLLVEEETNTPQSDDEKPTVPILSGVTMGSSFVGMVHILRKEETKSSQSSSSINSSIQAQMKSGAWFAHYSGGFGVDSSFSNDVKRLLSTQQLSSHCSIISHGCVPKITSNELKIGVKEFSDFDPAKMTEKLSVLANSTQDAHKSTDAAADAARTGGKMVSLRKAEIKSVMAGLAEVDDGKNKTFDINTLMTAFEDFVDQVREGKSGVPINFYVQELSRTQIAKDWLKHFYPDGVQPGNPVKDDKPSEDNANGDDDGSNGTAETDPVSADDDDSYS